MENPDNSEQNPMTGYDHTARDFQRTEDEIDDISASEKEAINDKKKDENNKKAEFDNKQDKKE
jgi:hypothetical protein